MNNVQTPFKTIVIEKLQNRLFLLSCSKSQLELSDNRLMATVLFRIAEKRGHVQARARYKYQALIMFPSAGLALRLHRTGQFPRNFWACLIEKYPHRQADITRLMNSENEAKHRRKSA